MHAKKLVPLLLLCLVARSSALSEDGKKLGDELVTTLQEEVKDLAEGDDANNQLASLKQYIRQVQNALAQENNRSIEQFLENYGNYNPTKKVQQQVAAIKKSMKDEVRQKTDDMITELQGLLTSTSETLTRAAEPEELDKLLLTLSRNRYANQSDSQGYDTNDATVRRLQSELGNARQFVTYWQDYLQASNSGNTAQALQSLRNLSNQENTLIPRSKIIARIEFEKGSEDDVNKVVDGVKSLADMQPAIQKLSRLQSGNRSSGSETTGLREALEALSRLDKIHREFLAGLPVNVEVLYQPSDSSDSSGRFDFIELRAALLLTVLPRCLALPEDFKATTGETVDHFLNRAMGDATGRGDTAASSRILEVMQQFQRSNTLNETDLAALRDHAAGRSQMAAGQYLLAVVSFQRALKTGSDLIPPVKTGELLESIRKEHPAEYEQGMTEFLTPRPTPEYNYNRMPYRGYTRYPDGGSSNRSGTTVVLPVPAKDDVPEKTATPAGQPKAPGE